jgi:hypothetical protein
VTYRELKNELMMSWDSHDRWGSAMSLFFDVAEELHRRHGDTPDSWQFRPGALGVGEPETYEAEIMTCADTPDLLRLGNVLYRYTGMLDRAGESY